MSRYVNTSRATWAQAVQRLKDTFEAWGIGPEDWQIEAGPPSGHRDRLAYGHPNWAMVTYRPKGSPNVVKMHLDTQESAAKNLSAIAITIEDIRMQERRGLGGIAAQHYLALAAPRTERDPYEVLGVRSDAPTAVIEASYKAQAKATHPDAGGTEAAFKEVAAAWERIKEERGVTA